jgi:hypothetical protein
MTSPPPPSGRDSIKLSNSSRSVSRTVENIQAVGPGARELEELGSELELELKPEDEARAELDEIGADDDASALALELTGADEDEGAALELELRGAEDDDDDGTALELTPAEDEAGVDSLGSSVGSSVGSGAEGSSPVGVGTGAMTGGSPSSSSSSSSSSSPSPGSGAAELLGTALEEAGAEEAATEDDTAGALDELAMAEEEDDDRMAGTLDELEASAEELEIVELAAILETKASSEVSCACTKRTARRKSAYTPQRAW